MSKTSAPAADRSDGIFEWGFFVPASILTRRLRLRALGLVAVVLLAAGVAAIGMVFHAEGGRWFIVDTPSMGTTAPVGSLILTQPVSIGDVSVGDVVSFTPPTETGNVYTHRVIARKDGLLSTRGDINGATDPWLLGQQNLLGRVATILPGVGWLVKALPLVALGALLLWTLTENMRSRPMRTATRVVGLSLVASVAAFLIKPFVGVVLLVAEADRSGAQATVVSTGLLPIRVAAKGGNAVDLSAGQVGTVVIDKFIADGHYQVASALNLTASEWVVAITICFLPLLWTTIVGLPDSAEAELA